MSSSDILAARSVGEGLPVLVIHGWKLNGDAEARDLEPIFEQIPGFRRIYIDLPGMGASPIGDIQNMDDIFDRIVQFIEKNIGSAQFLVIGTSAGGYLAQAVAKHYSKQVDGVLLRVPLMVPDIPKRDIDEFVPLIQDPTSTSSLSPSDRTLLGNVLVQTSKYVSALLEKYKAIMEPALAAADSKAIDGIRENPLRYALSAHLLANTEKCFAPALILTGRQDEVVGYRDTLRLIAAYPRSTFAVLDREVHALPIEDHALFEALVRDWISRVNEWKSQRR